MLSLSSSLLSPQFKPPLPIKFRRPLASVAAAAATGAKPSYLHSHQIPSPSSLYEVLEIPRNATSQEIKSAYRKLARVCHPDVAAVEKKDASAKDFMTVHAAYATLSDPEKRADYDRKRFQGSKPLTSGFSAYTCRNWETDQCW